MTAPTASTEPRGIAAAMSQPVFSTRTGESALGAADRATRRWAPESADDQPRAMRTLAFVDRTVTPWVTTSQRSAGLRMFSQYHSASVGERAVNGVSWVFPRPWYQDELDWIAASRAQSSGQGTVFTTRGTYARAGAQPALERAMPAALYEYVAPSFSPSFSGAAPSAEAMYSPLVAQSSYSAASIVAQSMRAIQSASALARGLAPSPASFEATPSAGVAPSGSTAMDSAARSLAGFGALAPLVSALIPEEQRPHALASAISLRAPELVTPPSPRGDEPVGAIAGATSRALDQRAAEESRSRAAEQSRAMAQLFAQERERLVVAQREQARARELTAAAPPSAAPTGVETHEAARLEALREAVRLEVTRNEATREVRARVQSSARQQARIDALVAERIARAESVESPAPVAQAGAEPAQVDPVSQQHLAAALRFAELMAHTAAVGPTALAPAAGPRVALPSGLGGLVAAVNTATAIERERAMPMVPRTFAAAPVAPSLPLLVAPELAASGVSGAVVDPAAQAPALRARAFALPTSLPSSFAPVFSAVEPESLVAARAAAAAAPAESALGAIAAQRPAALAHMAWSDRWLGRFAGASETSLEVMSTVAMRSRLAPEQHFVAPVALAERLVATRGAADAPVRSTLPLQVAAPVAVSPAAAAPVVAPAPAAGQARVDTAPAQPTALRFADDDVVPDDMLAAIMAPPRAAARPSSRPVAAAAPSAVAAAAAAVGMSAAPISVTAADVVALTAPSAPVDAGLSAALAASPMAPALAHVLPLPRAAVFDPRALAGVELTSAFLSGAVTAPIVTQRSFGPAAIASDEAVVASSPWQQWAAQWSAELVQPLAAPALGSSSGAVAATRALGAAPSAVGASGAAIGAAPSFPAGPAGQPVASGAPAALTAPTPLADEGILTMRSTLLAPATPRQQRLAASFGTAASWANHEAADSMPAAYQTLGEILAVVGASSAAMAARELGARGTLAAQAGDEAGALGEPLSVGAAGPWARSPELPVVMLPSLTTAAPGLGGFSAPLASTTAWPALAGGTLAAAASAAAARPSMSAPGAVTSAYVGAEQAAVDGIVGAPIGTSWTFGGAGGLPELGDLAAPLASYGLSGSMERGAHLPGMTAQRALGFGAVQSTQAADLSFDFVPPELVLAARVYGFGPAEAAQALRLAMGGSTGLAAMAGAVDLRFVAMAGPAAPASRDSREAARAIELAQARPADAAIGSVAGSAAPMSGAATSLPALGAEASFGVARRAPRGAFLLPSASVAAMGLGAAMPDGEHAMPLAALEILAAKMVAELGSYASPFVESLLASGAESPGLAAAGAAARSAGAFGQAAPVVAGGSWAGPQRAEEASEAAVLESAAASVGAARRARFDALYVALAESPAGRMMSPAARAARALALANRDEDAVALSSRERAALAWQIYPVVLGGEAAAGAAASQVSTGAAPLGRGGRGGRAMPALPTISPDELVSPSAVARPGAEMRPGLGALSARAGEALSSFVTASPSDAPRAQPADSGRGSWRSGRFGGGEVEIPSWFESAARKMFEEQRDVEGMSLAELTLIAAPPPTQIAAASRDTPAAAPARPAQSESKGEKGQKVDVEKVAREVYSAFMRIIESARMRNGEPYL